MKYDYVIVGGGPCGLTLALYLSEMGRKCALIDDNQSLGGCHRVSRDNSLFTEHGPRIYSSAYYNVKTILEKIGTSWDDSFTPYHFNIGDIQGYTFNRFSIREKVILVFEFLKLLCGSRASKRESMSNFTSRHSFSKLSVDYIDRICRLTDGAGPDRYTLYQFLQLANQNFGQTLYQPKHPNDHHIFKLWKEQLISNGVDLYTGRVTTIKGGIVTVDTPLTLSGDRVLVCVPPRPFLQICKASGTTNAWSNSLGFNLESWVKDSSYNDYIPITFHWKHKSSLPKRWGFPKGDWGVAFVILSDYMKPENDYDLVISTCVTFQDTPSYYNGKTANQCDENELITETFRQLKLSFPDLPPYDRVALYNKVSKQDGVWIDEDTAFIQTPRNQTIPIIDVDQSYYIGTHNGKSIYSFTSMESAVTNALFAIHTLEKTSNIQIKYPIDIITIIRLTIIILLFIIVYTKSR